VTPLPIQHGQRRIFSYEFSQNGRRIVYATDCSGIPGESLERMKGCDVFIVDALRHVKHPNHFSVSQALEAVEKVQPGRAFFTHITHDLPHVETEAGLPDGVKIGYDGLTIEV
jgi:phosphoribosyl 1,2-cyclic phosphate phosphodiesterase